LEFLTDWGVVIALVCSGAAVLYGVQTKALVQAVKRNARRFPEDFMFQVTSEEAEAVLSSRSQIVILKRGENIKYLPYVFTEHGVVMLANVLKSAVAIRASIQVVRAFVHLRRLLATNQQLARKIELLEKRVGKHDVDLQGILAMLRKLLEPPPSLPRRPFGFISHPPPAEFAVTGDREFRDVSEPLVIQ